MLFIYFFKNIDFLPQGDVVAPIAKSNSFMQQVRFKVACAPAISIQTTWSKSRNEPRVPRKSTFSEKPIFVMTESAHFDWIFSSAHVDIQRINNYEAINLTFINPIDHSMEHRVLFTPAVVDCSGCRKYVHTSGRFRRYN